MLGILVVCARRARPRLPPPSATFLFFFPTLLANGEDSLRRGPDNTINTVRHFINACGRLLSAMGDDALPASELRKRYLKGGSLSDSELSAGQVRARHGISSNAWPEEKAESGVPVIWVVLLGLAMAAALAWFALRSSGPAPAGAPGL